MGLRNFILNDNRYNSLIHRIYTETYTIEVLDVNNNPKTVWIDETNHPLKEHLKRRIEYLIDKYNDKYNKSESLTDDSTYKLDKRTKQILDNCKLK